MGKSINQFELKKQLSFIKFRGLEKYDNGVGNTVAIHLLEKKSKKAYLKGIIRNIFFESIKYEFIQKSSSILCVFSQSYITRKDHKKSFLKFINTFFVNSLIAINSKYKLKFSYLRYLQYPIIWMKQMVEINIEDDFKRAIVLNLLETKIFLDNLEKIHRYLEGCKLLITWCDAYLIDNYFTQFCKQKGIVTATLQHGQFPVTNEKNDYFHSGFQGFISDYFLAWGNYTKKHAIESGIPDEKIVCLGIPQYIGKKIRNEKKKRNVFGIILDENRAEQDNKKLVEIADRFAEKHEIKYLIKLHPAAKKRDYSDCIKSNYLEGYADLLESVESFSDRCDFFLVINSSVLTELIFLHKTVFHKTPEFVNDTYKDLIIDHFINEKELEILYISYLNSKDNKEKLFQEMCTTDDIENNYRRFLEYILKKDKNNAH